MTTAPQSFEWKRGRSAVKLVMMATLTVAFLLGTSAAVADEAHSLMRLSLPSLNSTTENIGKVMEQFSPGSSATLAMTASALAFNPRVAHFDLSSPIDLWVYGFDGSDSTKVQLGTCVALKIKKQFRDGFKISPGEGIHVKRISDHRAMLSESKNLLSQLEAPEVSTDTGEGLRFECNPKFFITHFRNHFDDLVDIGVSDLAKSASMSKRNLLAFKILKNNLRFLAEWMKQVEVMTGEIKFDETAVRCHSVITPEKGSDFDAFLKAQPADARLKLRFGANGRQGDSTLTLTPAAREAIKSFLRNLMVEISHHADGGGMAILDALVDGASGPCEYVSKISDSDYHNYFRLSFLNRNVDLPLKMLSRHAEKDGDCFRIDDLPMCGGDTGVIVKVVPGHVELVHGVQSAESLRRMLRDGRFATGIRQAENDESMAEIKFHQSDGELQCEFVVPFKAINQMKRDASVPGAQP